jgi:acyl carrier protein
MSNRYSNFIERGRNGLARLISDPKMQELIHQYPVDDKTRDRIRTKDFSGQSTFFCKGPSMATIEPARYLAKAVIDLDDETIKWFLLLYSVSSAREQFDTLFFSHFGERALSCLGVSRFYHGGEFDLRTDNGIAKLVDGVIDVSEIVSRCEPDSCRWYFSRSDELSQAISLFALSAGFDYLEDIESFPKKLLERSKDLPFILVSSEYISLMTGEDYADVFKNELHNHGVVGCLDDLYLMVEKENARMRLEKEKLSLEDRLNKKMESIRQQETAIEVLADSFGLDFSESAVQARISKCNDKEHRDILYKFESISGKKLSFLDDISETGLPIPFVDLIKNEYRVIISEKEILGIKTVENLADCIITHKRFIEHFVTAVQQEEAIEPLRDDDPYDLETRIEETEMFYHSKVDKEQIHSIDDLRLYVTGNDLLMQKIVSALVEQLGVEPEDVTMESNFCNDLGADSLDSIELLMNAEREYGIKIPDEETASIATVRDLYNVIVEKMQNLPNA